MAPKQQHAGKATKPKDYSQPCQKGNSELKKPHSQQQASKAPPRRNLPNISNQAKSQPTIEVHKTI